ncbi:MAG: hypothetical protein HC869_10480 [Rhodospirillales bacterium]|nr:hypothetical protein [Rhodospirillales bacterium]
MDAIGHEMAHGNAGQRTGDDQAETKGVGRDERADEGRAVANGLLDETIGERRQRER